MDDADLKAATEICHKEEVIFKAKETDLVETVDILERETSDTQNFEMLNQSLDDEIKLGEKEKDEAAKSKAGFEGVKAGAEDIKEVAGMHHNRMPFSPSVCV